MPTEQRGSVYKTAKGFGLRWTDEHGVRRRQAGFTSGSKAHAWYRDVERPRMLGGAVERPPRTLTAHVEAYLEAHKVGRDPITVSTLEFRLGYATKAFGTVNLRDLERRVPEIAAWTATLPTQSRYGIVQALRQCLEASVRWGDAGSNPAKLAGKNPPPKREEIRPFEPADVEKVAVELGETYGPIAILAAYTGLRPSEWTAIEWRDVDRQAGVLVVERSFAYGEAKTYGKTTRSRRRVPLPQRAVDALNTITRRLDTRLVFPSPKGHHLDLCNWRYREWRPALEAAGLWIPPPKGEKPETPCPRPYDLRHTYATWMLAAGVGVHELSRYMGTSLEMIDLTYGHLARGSEDAARSKLDAYAARSGQESATDDEAEDG